MDMREFLKIAIVTPFALSLFPQILMKDEGEEGLIFVSHYPHWYSEFAQMKLFSFAPISKDTFLANYPFKDRVPDIVELNDARSVKSLAIESKQADCLVIGLPKPDRQLYMAEAIADLAEFASPKFLLTPYRAYTDRFVNVVYNSKEGFASAFSKLVTFIVATEYPGLICYDLSDLRYICESEKHFVLLSYPWKGKKLDQAVKEFASSPENARMPYAKSGITLFFCPEYPTLEELMEATDIFRQNTVDTYYHSCYILPTPYSFLSLLSC